MTESGPARKVLVLLVPLILLVAVIQWRKSVSQHDDVTSTAHPLTDTESRTATSTAEAGDTQPLEKQTAEQPTKAPPIGTQPESETPISVEADDELEKQEWDGDWLTSTAIEQPVMSQLAATDPSYDGATEARQLFHPFETDLRAADPLDSDRYRALLSKHKSSNAATLRRVMDLQSEGRSQDATALYEEWSRLFELYRKQVYPQDSGK
jgi:septal ring-binding cell division protein DamX